MPKHSKKQAPVGALLFHKAPIEILIEYSDYNNNFLVKYVAKLLENTGINEHAIKLKEGEQPLFGLIYSLGLVELEILKTYIKTNLAHSFIWPFKSPARAPILFNKKLDRSFRFYVNYWGLNNIYQKPIFATSN